MHLDHEAHIVKQLSDQLRLYLAERFIAWAFRLTPDDSPEKTALARAIQIYDMDVFKDGIRRT